MGEAIQGTGRILTLPFLGNVSAGGEKSISSRMLSFPFTTRTIRVGFALNCNRTLRVKVFLSPDSDCPSSGEPNGFSVFSENSETDYLVGDDEWKICPHECLYRESGGYVKVYGYNTDAFDHTLDVLVTIQEIERA
jgi:hypothetical protein